MNYLEEFAKDMGLTEEQVKHAELEAEALLKEAGDNPEALIEMSKAADGFLPSGIRNQMMGTAGAVIAAMTAQEAYNAVRSGVGSMRDSQAKARAYKDMIRNNPQLQEEDARKVHQLFDTLHTFNPQYAQDPLVSGSFVSQGLQFQDMPGGILPSVNNLAQARKNLSGGGGRNDTFIRDVMIRGLTEAQEGPQRSRARPRQLTQGGPGSAEG